MKMLHRLLIVLASAGLAPPTASAQAPAALVNESNVTLEYETSAGTIGLIPPGAPTIFVPPGPLTLQTPLPGDQDILGFFVKVDVEPSGLVTMRQFDRPPEWSAFGGFSLPALYVESDTAFGNIDVEPRGVGEQYRRVRFMASSDCQFCSDQSVQGCNGSTPMETNELMGSKVDAGFRGVIVAGDLTQSESPDEFDQYLDSIAGNARHFFEGMGNHDLDNPFYSGINTYIRDKKRATVRSNRGPAGFLPIDDSPHYSWDWHDVHFVQLNIVPSDRVTSDENTPQREPYEALTYLTQDLEQTVGDSGRPVVLIHHYGFDDFSTGMDANNETWWDAGQRLDYWNVIKDYNIALIIVGHRHLGSRASFDLRYKDFERPPGATGGPDKIPAVNAAATRFGTHVEITINEWNEVKIDVLNSLNQVVPQIAESQDSGLAVDATRITTFSVPIYVDAASNSDHTPGRGFGWKDDPFPTIGLAIGSKNQPFFSVDTRVNRTVKIAPGNYTENEVLDGNIVVTPDGPGDIIINGN